MNYRECSASVRCGLIAVSLFSVHCGSSASSSGGEDASNVESGSSGSGSSSSGGSVVDAAAEDGSFAAADGSLDSPAAVRDSGSDSSAPASCLGSVTFRLVPGSSGRYCENQPCEWSDLATVMGSGGQTLTTWQETNGCFLVDCATCQGGGCSGACPAATPLPDGGAEVSWDGTVWTSAGTCQNGLACSRRSCASAGQYTAHMCAFGGPVDAGACFGGSASGTPVCVDVPFTYPAPGIVVGTLP